MRSRCCCCCDCTSAMKRAFTTKPAWVGKGTPRVSRSDSKACTLRLRREKCAPERRRRAHTSGLALGGDGDDAGGRRESERGCDKAAVAAPPAKRTSRQASRASAHTCWLGAETPSAARRRTCLRRACRRKSAQRPSPATSGDVSSAPAALYCGAAIPQLARCGRCRRAPPSGAWRGAARARLQLRCLKRETPPLSRAHLQPWRAESPRRRAAARWLCLQSPAAGASWAAGVPAPAPARRLDLEPRSARQARPATQDSRPCCRDDNGDGATRSRAQDGGRGADARWERGLCAVVP